jgi:AraC-like DNA-binding protein
MHVSYLLLLAVSKWLIVIILLLYNRNRNNSVYLLAAGLLMMSLFDINHYLAVSGISQFLTTLVYLYSSPFVMLIGPLFYLYVRNTMADRNVLTWRDLLHTIPFWLMWINHLPFFSQPFSYQYDFAARIHSDLNAVREPAHYWFLSHYPLNMVRGGIGLAYFIACLWRIHDYVKSMPLHPEVPRRQSIISLRWIGFLTATLILVSLVFLFMTHDIRNENLSARQYQSSVFFFLLLLIYAVLSLCLLFFPEILYGLPRATIAPNPIIGQSSAEPSADENAAVVPEKLSGPATKNDEKTDPFSGLAQSILLHMEQEKPYLRTTFSVTELSMHFGVPRHHIDYCFSRIIGEKFIEVRKRLRVEHAKHLLPNHQNMSMDGIGREAGFASKSSFFTSFREVTGMTPAEFIRDQNAG